MSGIFLAFPFPTGKSFVGWNSISQTSWTLVARRIVLDSVQITSVDFDGGEDFRFE